MPRFLRCALCLACLAAMTLLAGSVGKEQANRRRAARRLNDWDIATLATHLQYRGMEVRLCSVFKNGPPGYSAYLTSTANDWHRLNALNKDPRRIAEWRGTLYCERVGASDCADLLEQWDENGLKIGPFLFYGDVELLRRVRDALTALPAAP